MNPFAQRSKLAVHVSLGTKPPFIPKELHVLIVETILAIVTIIVAIYAIVVDDGRLCQGICNGW